MKETPILYSAEMIRAYLQGEKSMTRRTMGLSIINDPPQRDAGWQLVAVFQDGCARFSTPNGGDITLQCPYGGYGDRLWVRERHRICCVQVEGRTEIEHRLYYGDGTYKKITTEQAHSVKNWASNRPSIFMPRFASRITQTIKEIRIERLQDISYTDCANEGFGSHSALILAKEEFVRHWDFLNAKRGYPFSSNCWVWVIVYPTH